MLALFQSLFVWLSWCRSKLFRLVDDPKWTWWWPYAWGLKAAPPSSSSSSSSSSPSSSASTGLPAVVTLRPSAPPPRRHGSAHTQGPQGQGHSQRGRTRFVVCTRGKCCRLHPSGSTPIHVHVILSEICGGFMFDLKSCTYLCVQIQGGWVGGWG